MSRNSLQELLLLCLLSSTVSRTAAVLATADADQLFGLRPRDDLQCQSSKFKQCGGNFPGNFCCSQDATCMPMNGGKSAICCPADKDGCNIIGTISCDLQQQNATSHPLSQLFTTDLTTSLQKCGSMCCPAGMACQGDSQCVMLDSKTSSSATASTSNTASSAASSASSPTQNPATPSSSNNASNQNLVATSHCNQFATPGLLVGFFSGLASGVIATILSICCIGRTRSNKRDSGDLSSVQASVSDPIYDPDASASYRTDFLRRKSNNRTSRTSSRVKSLFSMKSPTSRSRPSPATAGPKTPQMQKTSSRGSSASMESIKIYSPPNLGRETSNTNTTFGMMLEQAGLKEGQPYLGPPGRIDGRSRPVGDLRSSSLKR